MMDIEDQWNTGPLVHIQHIRGAEANVIVFEHQSPLGWLGQISITRNPTVQSGALVVVNSAHMDDNDRLWTGTHRVEYLCLRGQVFHALTAQCPVGRIHHNVLRRVKREPQAYAVRAAAECGQFAPAFFNLPVKSR
jgi:hypothetical protein